MTITGHDARTQLLDAFRHSGQILATLYVPSASAVQDAAQRLEVRSSNALRRLESAGAPDDLLAIAADALDRQDHDAGEAVVLVVSSSEVLVEHHTIRPVVRPITVVDNTPLLLPLLAATQSDLDHVAVLLDRTGAEVWTRSDLGQPIETTVVAGDDLHVHRGHPGGWSQRRFQQRAENTWEDNARLVAEELKTIGGDRAITVIGGDVRAVGFLREQLPGHRKVIEVDGSRSADHDAFLDEVDDAVRSVAAERLAADIQDVRGAIGQGRGVVDDEVLDLASQGRVDRLFVVDDSFAIDRRSAPFDFAVPMHVPGGSSSTVAAPVTEGAVALGVATGADIVVLPAAGIPGIDTLAAIIRG